MNQGDLEASEQLIAEALALREALSDSSGIATALINRGALEQRRGASLHARTAYQEALQRFIALGDRRGEANALEGIAEVFLSEDRVSEALRLLQEVSWLRQEYQILETAQQKKLHFHIRALQERATTPLVEQPGQ